MIAVKSIFQDYAIESLPLEQLWQQLASFKEKGCQVVKFSNKPTLSLG